MFLQTECPFWSYKHKYRSIVPTFVKTCEVWNYDVYTSGHHKSITISSRKTHRKSVNYWSWNKLIINISYSSRKRTWMFPNMLEEISSLCFVISIFCSIESESLQRKILFSSSITVNRSFTVSYSFKGTLNHHYVAIFE